MDQFNELLYKFIKRPARPIKCPAAKVLIIDDNSNIQRALERTLSQMNYDVIVKTTGKDGIESLTEEISVVVLDVKLPKMNGTDVYNMLKEKIPQVPIIFYSAYPGNEKMAKKCLSLKPYAFIEKGVAEDIDTLYLSIEKAAKGNKHVKR